MTLGVNALEETFCRALFPAAHDFTSDELYACHQLRNRKLKQNVQVNCKSLPQK